MYNDEEGKDKNSCKATCEVRQSMEETYMGGLLFIEPVSKGR